LIKLVLTVSFSHEERNDLFELYNLATLMRRYNNYEDFNKILQPSLKS